MRIETPAKWRPTPHHAYFMHVASAPNGSACGLVLARSGSGRVPCRGYDKYLDDYMGDVLESDEGRPFAGARVFYTQQVNGADKVVAEAVTDRFGKHELRLEPGIYTYRYAMPLGTPDFPTSAAKQTDTFEVTVAPGRPVHWDGGDEEGMMTREVGFVTEDMVVDWNGEDNRDISWHDVEETILRICDKVSAEASGVNQVSFARFARPDVIASLQTRGVNAVDSRWTDIKMGAAFRNLTAMLEAEFLDVLGDESSAINYQTECVVLEGRKVKTRYAGQMIYLAEARACAVYYAALEAAWSPHGNAMPFYSVSDMAAAPRHNNSIANAIEEMGFSL